MMRLFLPFLLGLGFVPLGSAAEPSAEDLEFFEKRIRPLLVKNCYRCHSKEKRKRGGLLLDSRSGIHKGGDSGAVVVPGEPDKSRLIQAIRYKDPELRMPPRSKLDAKLIADLEEWVKRGAPTPKDTDSTTVADGFDLEKRKQSHWAFQPLGGDQVPEVRQEGWARSALDRFILARLEKEGMKPSEPTDRRTWLRRAAYGLIGLPPTPEEIEAFLADRSEDAFERVVDRLLASPHYGERWARHWLDLVRFAETAGHEFDFELPLAFEYRDYVIRALNQDVPYKQFVMEHLAGDLLPEPRRNPLNGINESIIGTGFFHLGEGKHSPVDILAEFSDRTDNQIDVLSKAFLGLTVGCARCHDHKFDAISQRDYYALSGYIRSSRFHRADVLPHSARGEVVVKMREAFAELQKKAISVSADALLDNLNGFSSHLLEASRQDTGKAKVDPVRLDRLQKELQKVNPNDGQQWLAAWKKLVVPNRTLTAEQFSRERDALIENWKRQARKGEYEVFVDFRKKDHRKWFVTGDAFGNEPLEPGNALIGGKGRPVNELRDSGTMHSGLVSRRLEGALRSPSFVINSNRIALKVAGQGTKINLIIDGFQRIRNPIYGSLTQVINGGERLQWRSIDVHMWKGHRAYIECLDEGDGWLALQQVVFTDGALPPEGVNSVLAGMLKEKKPSGPGELAKAYEELLKSLVSQWKEGKLAALADGAEREQLLDQMLKSAALNVDMPVRANAGKWKDLKRKLDRLEGSLPRPRRVMALVDGTGEDEPLYIRGNHNNPGPMVPRRALEVIAGREQPVPEGGSGRLALAARLVSSANPLLPRVMVNRLWHHHFGRGIVGSPDDFGIQGQRPTHPELLDWLARRFVSEGWSLKKMHKLIVLSSTYRQSSHSLESRDPENKLLHRMSIRRLEAEAIRDAILQVSGRLQDRMYGKGVMPHLTPHMTGRGRPRRSGPLDGDGRRSIYVNVRRNFLTPFFLAFDYPVPFTTMGRRSVSNVPAQALAMMNNPFVRQQAEIWAREVVTSPVSSNRDRIERVYVKAFGRPPTDREAEVALAFLSQPDMQNEHRAWSELCHVLFNVKEFIFIN